MLGEFVVMPNHVHGIVVIQDKASLVPTSNDKSTHENQTRFQNQGKDTISSIIGGYKSAVTRQCRQFQRSCRDKACLVQIDTMYFAWQQRFYDRIIRNDSEYNRITEYINNNPITWKDDKLWIS